MTSDKFNLLDTYNAQALAQMAEAADLDIKQNGKKMKKGDLILFLEKEYFTQERIAASLAKLSPLERKVLERLQLRHGLVTTTLFKRELIRAGLAKEPVIITPKKGVDQAPLAVGSLLNRTSEQFEDIIARLTYQGLVFSRTVNTSTTSYGVSKMEFNPGPELFIPSFIQPHLPKPEPLPQQKSWQPVTIHSNTPDLLLRDLYLYWNFVRQEPVPLLQTGLVGKRSLKLIKNQLLTPIPDFDTLRQESDSPRLYYLRHMLQELKLIQVEGNLLKITSQTVSEIPAFWQLPLDAQVKQLLAHQINLMFNYELNRESDSFYPQINSARQLLLKVLKEQPPFHWLEMDNLLEMVQNQNENFLFSFRTDLRSKQGYGYYRNNIYYYGERKELDLKLTRIEESFVQMFVILMLFDLGLVDVGFKTEAAAAARQWQALRLTPLGAAVLDLAPHPEVPTPTGDQGRVVVQPNFQVLAIGPVPLSILAQLDLFATRQKVDRGVIEYQLSRDSVYQGQQAGMGAPEIVAHLTQLTGQPLPQNVQRSLEEWGAHHDRIVFRPAATLLQTASPELLTLLQKKENTKKYLVRPLMPDIALVTPHKKKHLVAALLDNNLLPTISGVTPDATENSVIIQADGRIETIHAVPGLHVRGRISRIAQEISPNQWQITPERVRQVGGSKSKVQALLTELNKLSREPLAASLVTQIKAWGEYYGAAAVETLTLIEFRDQETLDELLKQAPLRRHLRPFPTQDRALAIVTPEALPEVKASLSQLGITLTQQIISPKQV
ncbi:MAG: helicase-associated domain-containing protein [Chloroflexi bacterium]|nr:helicase-associated domain-containing protein [Chloroflexota bacterium]